MNTKQLRVVDPVLSNIALGYKNGKFIGERVAPRVPVTLRGGQILQFGKEAFMQYRGLRRAPGADRARVSLGYLGAPFALVQDAIEAKVPVEHQQEAANAVGVDLGARGVNLVMQIVKLALEVEIKGVATNAASFNNSHKATLAGTDKWSDYANSDPGAQMDDYKEAIRQSIGDEPNLLTLGAQVYKVLKRHPKVLEKFKYTSSDSITPQHLADYFDVSEIQVGKAVTADDAGTMSDVWGNVALLSYSPESPAGMEEPSFSYTYTLNGSPSVLTPYFEDRNGSWMYPVEYERAPVLTCADAGFLIQAPV